MDPIRFDPAGAVRPTRASVPGPAQAPGAEEVSGPQFAENLKSFIGEVNAQQLGAEQSIAELASGRAANIHEVVISVAKADLSFKLLLELRNKLVEAYQKTMNMQL